MPRTVESIVASHQAARTRRAAGKPSWALQVDIKAILAQYEDAGDDLTAEQAIELSKKIGAALRAAVPASWFDANSEHFTYDFEDNLERFEQASASDFTPTDDCPDDEPAEVINAWLDELYDWGDRSRVWLG